MWQQPDVRWGGMDQGQLTLMTAQVGELLEITPEQAKKIQVIFGDNIVVEFIDTDESHTNTAFCIADSDKEGNIKGCRIIINRSEELALASAETINHEESSDGRISCEFDDPYENIVWLIAEEMHHAKYWSTAKDIETADRWQQRYDDLRKRKGIVSSEGYSNELIEVAASRNALRILKKMNPHRTAYYQELYDRSLRESKHVIPDITKIENIAFVKTGYVPRGKPDAE